MKQHTQPIWPMAVLVLVLASIPFGLWVIKVVVFGLLMKMVGF